MGSDVLHSGVWAVKRMELRAERFNKERAGFVFLIRKWICPCSPKLHYVTHHQPTAHLLLTGDQPYWLHFVIYFDLLLFNF